MPLNIQKLSDYFGRLGIDQLVPVIVSEEMKGGRSNPNYLLTTKSGKYVLRRQPFGKILRTAHNLKREYIVQSALFDSKVPVPQPILFCDNKEILGVDFYVMRYVHGDNHRLFKLPGLSTELRRNIYLGMIETLANIHKVGLKEKGLADFGKSGNYFARQHYRWQKAFELSLPEGDKKFSALSEWLADHIPDESPPSLIHGDFRLDNLIFKSDTGEVKAVLDWELATLGDPLSDLGYFLGILNTPDDFVMPGLKGTDRNTLGIPEEEEMVTYYCQLTSRTNIPDLSFYKAFGFFRLSAICAGIKARVRQGNAVDPQSKLFGSLTGSLAELGIQQLANNE